MEEFLFFLLLHIWADVEILRDSTGEVHGSITTDASLYCGIGTIKLSIGFLQQGRPELIGDVGSEVDQLAISKNTESNVVMDFRLELVPPGRKSVIHHDLIPFPQPEEPEPEDPLVVPPLKGLARWHHLVHVVRPLCQGGERGCQPAVFKLTLVDVKPASITSSSLF